MAISVTGFTSVVNAALDYYFREDALAQNLQDTPFLRDLEAGQKEFPGGKGAISRPVQGAWASDSAFLAGYNHADTVSYVHPDNLKRASYDWKELHCGIEFTGTELTMDGISVVDSLNGAKVTEMSDREEQALTDLLDNKLEDMMQSRTHSFNKMLWDTGATDTKVVPGVTGFVVADPTTGTLGGLSRASNTWWRNRALTGNNAITANAADQTLSRKLRTEVRQLRKFGARPDRLYAGSGFIEKLEWEVQAKGVYTESGFANAGKTDIGLADISMRGVGTIQYDPTLDDLNLNNFLFLFPSKRLQLMPISGEAWKNHAPARPYDQYVYLRAQTWKGALCLWQPNGCGLYEAA